MPGSDELFPPVQYGWGWVLLAIGVVLVLLGAAALVIWLTRPLSAPSTPQTGAPTAPQVIAQLRAEYTSHLDAVAARYGQGAIDARQAHVELSRLVRGFVNEYSGIETPVLSLTDLRRARLNPALADAVGRSYPSIFARGAATDPRPGLAAAREVVARWY